MRKAFSLLVALGFFVSTEACFDTYLFLQKGSMVYPKGMLVLDGAGEYTIHRFSAAQEDLFTANTNIYYGIHERFSAQAGVASGEKDRASFSIDQWGLRGVGGIIQNYKGFYNLDVILECASAFNMKDLTVELSGPNIFYVNNFIFVVHPVLSMGRELPLGIRGHGGVFFNVSNMGIVGIGAEYESAQSGSQFGRRLVDGEAGTSLFLGARLGQNAYLQNEFIKGWGEGAKDFGYAATIKYAFKTGTGR